MTYQVIYQNWYQLDVWPGLKNNISSDGMFTAMPMNQYDIETVSMASILVQMGGLWRIVVSMTFLAASLFLYKNMLEQQAGIIHERTQPGQPVTDEVKGAIVEKMKKRLSFVSMYELYDRLLESEKNKKALQAEVQKLQSQMKQIIE